MAFILDELRKVATLDLPANEQMVIGDATDASTWRPHILLTKWSGENKLGFSLPGVSFTTLTTNTDRVELESTAANIYFDEVTDLQAIRFGLILKTKPPTNVLEFDIVGDVEEYDFHYQGTLEEDYEQQPQEVKDRWPTAAEWIAWNGKQRPENVIGSYAVYHKTKRNHVIGRTNYQAGKVAHLFRPKVTDALGNWTWVTLEIDTVNRKYREIVPQAFLNTATYPLTFNGTFGYTTQGTSSTNSNTGYTAYGQLDATSPAGSNTLTNLSVCLDPYDSSGTTIKFGFYDESSSNPVNQEAVDAAAFSYGAAKNFYTNSVAWSFSLVASTQYWGAWSSIAGASGYAYFYDTGGSKLIKYTVNVLPDPVSSPSTDQSNVHVSCYATYEAAGSANVDQSDYQFFASGDELPHYDAGTTTYDQITVTSDRTSAAAAGGSVYLPATVNNYDTLILVAGYNDDTPAASAPADWTTIQHSQTTGNDRQLLMAYKYIPDATGVANSAMAMGAGSDPFNYWVASLSGVASASATEQFAGTDMVDYTNGTTMYTKSFTTATPSAYVVAAMVSNRDTSTTPPGSPWTTEVDDKDDGNSVLSVSTQIVASSGSSTGSASWTGGDGASEFTTGIAIFKPRAIVGADVADGRSSVASVNTSAALSGNVDYGFQFRLENTGSTYTASAYKIQYYHVEGDATWTDVTCSSEVVKAVPTADFTEGSDVTEYIHGTGTYLSDNNAALETVGNLTLSVPFSASYAFEGHLNFQVLSADVNSGDIIRLRLVKGDGTALDSYTVTATIVAITSQAGTTLAGLSIDHALSADSVTLTQLHNLLVSEISHTHSIDAFNATQLHNILMSEVLHGHTIDAITSLPVSTLLAIAAIDHAHSIDAVNLSQLHNLLVAEGTHAHTVDALTLTQLHNLLVAELSHTHSVDALAIAHAISLLMSSIDHAHSIDAVSLGQLHSLLISELTHLHSVDALTLGQLHALLVSEIAHGHTVDALALGQLHNLLVSEVTHGHSIESITALAAKVVLVVEELAHTHSIDAVSLGQLHNLLVAELTHGHTIDSIATLAGSVRLVIDEITHSHPVEAIALTQLHTLIMSEVLHAHTIDAVTIAQMILLIVEAIAHGHSIDTADLDQIHNLLMSDATHAHTIDAITLSQLHLLGIQEILHSHTTDNINLVYEGMALILESILHSHTIDEITLSQDQLLVVQDCYHGVLDQIVSTEGRLYKRVGGKTYLGL